MLLLAAIACRTPDPVSSGPTLDVAGAGQSNMEGSANGLPGFPIPEGAELYDHGLRVDHFGKGVGAGVHHGPEAAFLQELAQAGIRGRFAKHAVAGTPIAMWIDTYAGELVAQTEALDLRPEVLIWMHGGADSQGETLSAAYPERLSELVAVFREAWGDDLLVVVVGLRAEAGDPHLYADEIRRFQREYVASDSKALYLDVMDAAIEPGDHMYGTSPGCDPLPEGVGLVGRRAARAVLDRLSSAPGH